MTIFAITVNIIISILWIREKYYRGRYGQGEVQTSSVAVGESCRRADILQVMVCYSLFQISMKTQEVYTKFFPLTVPASKESLSWRLM